MPEELKPCRFCGNHADLVAVKAEGHADPFWSVQCICLECYRLPRAYKTQELAIQAWNEKQSAPELDAKPCPFCGQKPRIFNRTHRDHNGREWHIHCNDVSCAVLINYWDTPEEAVAAWNRRAANA